MHRHKIFLVFLLIVLFLCAAGTKITSCWRTVILRVDGKERVLITSARTVKELLTKEKVFLRQEDRVEPALDSPLVHGMLVKVKRAVPVYLVEGEKKRLLYTAAGTVEEFLRQSGLRLQGEDRVEPAPEAPIRKGMIIILTRVTYRFTEEVRELPCSVVEKEDPMVEKGLTRILQEGEKGQEKIVWQVVWENGKVVARRMVAREVLKEPKPRLVGVGVMQLASRGRVPFRFKKVLQMEATAYTWTGQRTAAGITPRRGVVAVDPAVIPLGSRLYVEGYGYATAADTGGDIVGNRIDLFMESLADAVRWGRRRVKVYFLD
ncbi:MAG: hypothetical protein PWQ91_1400 [Eubacteriales bacterium]|nr:hypothetical protein [Eubacteriales bacterium]